VPVAPANRLLLRFALAFFALVTAFAVLVRIDVAVLDGAATQGVTEGASTAVAAVMRAIGSPIVQEGNQLAFGATTFVVVANCTGIEIIGLFIAAVLAFPTSARVRLQGLALGLPILIGLNLIRMVSLVYIGAWSSAAMEYGHLYVWPFVLLVVALGVWLSWAQRSAHGWRLVA
jgi:exosortase/archaeosortase family protein